MTFSMSWRFPPLVAGFGKLPVPLATVYWDAAVPSGGTGTIGDPFGGALPGLENAGDARISSGTRVVCRGTLHPSGDLVGSLRRGGTALNPIVYVGNDPAFGQFFIDGSLPLTFAPCANQADAFGNTNWANMRRSTLTTSTGIEDYLHPLYSGANRDVQYFAGYPQLSNADAYNYEVYASPASFNDVIWYDGIPQPPVIGDFVSGQSMPRIDLAAANTAMGLSAGTLEAALDADCVPVVQMRINGNAWETFRAGRCDANGALNPSGGFLRPIDGFVFTSNPAFANPADNRYRILNVAKAIDRAGQYALNPVAGWLVGWPSAGDPTWHRGQGKSGIRIGADHVWLHGFRIGGLSASKSGSARGCIGIENQTGASPPVTTGGMRVQRCELLPVGSIGPVARDGAHIILAAGVVCFNTLGRRFAGRGIGGSSGGKILFNTFTGVAGTNISVSNPGGVIKDVVIGGNLITDNNDIHGNGISSYAMKHNVIVEYNVVKDSGRPLTFEKSTSAAYDEATHGPASVVVRYNTTLASGIGTSAAIRFQESGEKGIIVQGNKMHGGPFNFGLMLAESSTALLNPGPWTQNTIVGGVAGTHANTLITAGTGNVQWTRDSAEGIALLADWSDDTVDVTYAPQGVGHTGGGWNGES